MDRIIFFTKHCPRLNLLYLFPICKHIISFHETPLALTHLEASLSTTYGPFIKLQHLPQDSAGSYLTCQPQGCRWVHFLPNLLNYNHLSYFFHSTNMYWATTMSQNLYSALEITSKTDNSLCPSWSWHFHVHPLIKEIVSATIGAWSHSFCILL